MVKYINSFNENQLKMKHLFHKENDVRIQILKKLQLMGHATEEVALNEFLATLKTYGGGSDLGTIIRAIRELIKEEYICESPIRDVVNGMSSKGDRETFKSTRRFIETVGDAPQIGNLYLFITLKGKNFLIENQKLNLEYTLTKWKKYSFWPLALISVAAFVISLVSLNKDSESKTQKTDLINGEIPLLQKKEEKPAIIKNEKKREIIKKP